MRQPLDRPATLRFFCRVSSGPLSLPSVSRLPSPVDNVAIAIRRLDPGTVLAFEAGPSTLAHTVLEGHRFAVRPIAPGEALLSWGMSFGVALTSIAAGDYVCNQSILDALAVRRVEGAMLPAQPNFADNLAPFAFDETRFRSGPAIERARTPRMFAGYRRPGNRGVGTRNYIVILGTSSRTASFARQLTARLQPLARVHPGIDGIVAIAHTEGGGPEQPNNFLEMQRALGGFMVHPNVAAVLAIDYGTEPMTNMRLRGFMREHHYPLDAVPHHFLTLDRGLAAGMEEGERIVRSWLPEAHALCRTEESMSQLRVALQCGGSDAFSGVSGNPLAGAMVHEVLRQGGTGVLTETDESMGAEAYMVRNVRDLATARAFLGKLDLFREKMSWHGLTAESNPSAGNKFRGLYNIALKSLGAVHKKDPRSRLDTVIDYAQPLRDIAEPGFTFMNGPGNDLEGVAGQIAAGCNLVIFVTGNGSITNFPFVPTLKITTTTRRHQLLIHEMDINAGRYLDGEPMEQLTAESVDLLLATAAGKKSQGERAGHSQVSIWRNWRQTDTSRLAGLRARTMPDGKPLPVKVAAPAGEPSAPMILSASPTATGIATERVALVLPTSLCATQIARMAADRMNEKQLGHAQGIDRFVGLMHTEGCGFGGETMYHLLHRTYRGYLTHPNVAAALLLEHGCEKIPNDVMRRQLEAAGVPLERFGWASVQLDGGIEKAIGKIEAWFADAFAHLPTPASTAVSLGALQLGLMASGTPDAASAAAFAHVAAAILAAGGSVLLPESDPLLAHEAFRGAIVGDAKPHATLAYGQPLQEHGLHLVATETSHWVENATGLGGCGAHAILGLVTDTAQQGHPLVPVVQVASIAERGRIPSDDIDAFLNGDPAADGSALLRLLIATLQRDRIPVTVAQGFTDFQLTRGELGLTT